MAEKTINGRIVNKHETESVWNDHPNFIPYKGEIIIYDIDDSHNYERMKIGDGKTKISNLPFANDKTEIINELKTYVNETILGGEW
jgi:hypothetical protein